MNERNITDSQGHIPNPHPSSPFSSNIFFFNNPIKENRLVVRRAEITGWSGRGGDFFSDPSPRTTSVTPLPNPAQICFYVSQYIFNVHHLKKKQKNKKQKKPTKKLSNHSTDSRPG